MAGSAWDSHLDRWPHACQIERARAQRFLRRSPLERLRSGAPIPVKNAAAGVVFAEVLRGLHALLHARGTICSELSPCTVNGTASGLIQVCLGELTREAVGTEPVWCEVVVPPRQSNASFYLKKGCSAGLRARCFTFSRRLIDGWVERLRQHAHGAATKSLRNKRCAVVLSGHTLRCSEHAWYKLIDDARGHYQRVLRANERTGRLVAGEFHITNYGGSRTHWTVESGGAGSPRCKAQLLPVHTRCLSNAERSALSNVTAVADPGLGIAKSGGSVLNVALAACKSIDVFGSGMFSDGPGSDVVYMHWYDKRFASTCRHECVPGYFRRTTEGRRGGGGLMSSKNILLAPSLCRPHMPCDAPLSPGVEKYVHQSERAHDFFFLSEVRLYVLHALGHINWVWY